MKKTYSEFMNQLDPVELENLSEEISKSFSEQNGYENGQISKDDFVTFANYSAQSTTLFLLEKYHNWLN